MQLRHGTAISWDGRLIRHCSSLSRPDGPVENPPVKNHVYGTFTAAKDRIVDAGRKRATLYQTDGGGEEIVLTEDDEEHDNPPVDPMLRPRKRYRPEELEHLRGAIPIGVRVPGKPMQPYVEKNG